MPEYVFNNLETPDPQFTFDFTFQGKGYRLRQNAVVKLPEEIADHLNGLATPVYADVHDPETGEMVSRAMGTRKRFSLVPATPAKAKEAKGN